MRLEEFSTPGRKHGAGGTRSLLIGGLKLSPPPARMPITTTPLRCDRLNNEQTERMPIDQRNEASHRRRMARIASTSSAAFQGDLIGTRSSFIGPLSDIRVGGDCPFFPLRQGSTLVETAMQAKGAGRCRFVQISL